MRSLRPVARRLPDARADADTHHQRVFRSALFAPAAALCICVSVLRREVLETSANALTNQSIHFERQPQRLWPMLSATRARPPKAAQRPVRRARSRSSLTLFWSPAPQRIHEEINGSAAERESHNASESRPSEHPRRVASPSARTTRPDSLNAKRTGTGAAAGGVRGRGVRGGAAGVL